MDALASFNYYGPTPVAMYGSALIAGLFVAAMTFVGYATELAQSSQWQREAGSGLVATMVAEAGSLVEPARLRGIGTVAGLVIGLALGIGQGQSGGGDLDLAFGVLVRAPLGAVLGALAGILSASCGRALGRRSAKRAIESKPASEARKDEP